MRAKSGSFAQTPLAFVPAGFSLLELLVALSLMGAILTMLYGAFFQVSNASLSVKKSLEARQELRLLSKIVLDDLQSVQYLEQFVKGNSPETQSYHTGILSRRGAGPNNSQPSFIHFHAAVPSRFYPEAKAKGNDPFLHEISYSLNYDSNRQRWKFNRREDFYINADLTRGGREEVLSESVVEFELEFLQQNIQQAGASELQESWVKEWDSTENACQIRPRDEANRGKPPCLPLAIRLKMSLEAEDKAVFTDILEINLPVSLQP